MSSKLNTFVNCKKIFIAGPVGVGKSTFIRNFSKYMINNNKRFHIIPEYIDGDPNGRNMLLKFLNKEIDNFEFQMYILNFYDQYMQKILDEIKEDDIIVFERLPDEGIAIFANISWNQDPTSLTEQNMRKLYYKVIEIDAKYGLPCIFNVSLYPFTFTCIKSLSDADFTQTAISLIEACKDHIVIGLYNTTDICYKRIIIRAREGETLYTYDDTDRFVQMYMNMYEYILRNTSIPFTAFKSLYYTPK